MPPFLEGQPNNVETPPKDPRSAEFLEHQLKAAEGREEAKLPDYMSEFGTTSDLQDVERAKKHLKEAPEGMHMEAGVEMPLVAKDENQKRDLVNKMIDVGDGDGDEMTKFLQQNV